MMVDETKFNLDAQSVPDAEEPEEGQEVEQAEVTGASEPETQETETVVDDEPARIPYSRFETVHERAIRAEAELEILRREAQESPKAEAIAFTGEMPEKWVKLYGDNEASREAYGLYRQGVKEEFATMKGELINEVRREEQAKEQHAEEIAEEWASEISDFAAKHSRKFSDADESAILDIMDELAPKDERGDYVVSPMTYLNQAVELHDLRNQKAEFAKKEAKRKTASLAGARGEGEPSGNQNDGHFRPGDWQSWRNNPALRG